MKYTFNTELVYLNPKEGEVQLPNLAEVAYKFTRNVNVQLTIDGWYFSAQEIEDLKELLTAFQDQLKKQS